MITTAKADPIHEAEGTERKMPIQATGELDLRRRRGERVVVVRSLPFALFVGEAIERQSERNHRQSVARIAERGGYSACEALAVIAGLEWDRVSKLDEEAAHRILYAMHVAYNRGRRWGIERAEGRIELAVEGLPTGEHEIVSIEHREAER